MRNCFWFNCFWKLVLMLLCSYILKLDWLHLGISVLKNYIHPISFSLSCIYMHVLYNDFLNILIIGLNVASHHKQCGSGWLFFFSLLMLLGMQLAIDHGNLGELQPWTRVVWFWMQSFSATVCGLRVYLWWGILVLGRIWKPKQELFFNTVI